MCYLKEHNEYDVPEDGQKIVITGRQSRTVLSDDLGFISGKSKFRKPKSFIPGNAVLTGQKRRSAGS